MALLPTDTMVRGGLFLIASTFWILYFHEILFRSGQVRTQWLKKRLADLVLLLLIALLSSLILLLVVAIQSSHQH